LLLCGADGLLSPAGPPHPPPLSVRLGSLVKRPSLGMSSRPHLTIGTSCSQGAPASQRRRGAHPARPPRSVAPPRTARWPVTDPVSRKNLCVRMRPYGPGSEIQTPSGTVLGVACRAWFFRHISVGSGGNIKLPSSPVN
jgi:hypothetical protein